MELKKTKKIFIFRLTKPWLMWYNSIVARELQNKKQNKKER